MISLLLAATLLSATSCVRGGNVDKDGDGNIGDGTERTQNGVMTDALDPDKNDDGHVNDGVIDDDDKDVDDNNVNNDNDGNDDDLGSRMRRGLDGLSTMTPDDLIPDGLKDNDNNASDNARDNNTGNGHGRGSVVRQ